MSPRNIKRITQSPPKVLTTPVGRTTGTFSLFSTQIKDLKTAKKEWSERLLKTPRAGGFRALAVAASLEPDQNVVGVGIGEQIVDDKPTGLVALKFFVRAKYPKHELSRKLLLPTNVAGYAVDVEEVGLFRRFAIPRKPLVLKAEAATPNPKAKIRPAQPGCSIGFRAPNDQFTMAGTFGALVTDSQGTYVLSNNHVLADEGQLRPGVPIFQPGLLDGGSPSTDQIASLTKFIALQPTGNQVDCAVAKVTSNNLVSPNVLLIGKPAGTAKAAIDMSVHKFGRTTAYTAGRVASIDTDVTVTYETGTFAFQEQIIIVGQSGAPFSAAGDSGSLILERGTNNAIGLLFAGSNTHTIANHIDDVLTALKMTLV
jgi:Peptidase family S64